jgi:hypothetical protein
MAVTLISEPASDKARHDRGIDVAPLINRASGVVLKRTKNVLKACRSGAREVRRSRMSATESGESHDSMETQKPQELPIRSLQNGCAYPETKTRTY